MKKIILLAFIALGSLIVSCGKCEEEHRLEDNTWYLESTTINDITFWYHNDECKKQTSINFSAGNYTAVYYKKNENGDCVVSAEEKGTYTTSGNSLTTTGNDNGITIVKTFSIADNALTIKYKEPESDVEQFITQVWKKR